MPFLRTAQGTECECDFMGTNNNYSLYVKVSMDLNDVLSVFQNPEETKVLQWVGDTGDIVRTETGFTKFNSLTIMGGKCPVRVNMLKEF